MDDLSKLEVCGPETKPGDRVFFRGVDGWPGEVDAAAKFFVVSQKYTVMEVAVGDSRTELRFMDAGWHNSVLFGRPDTTEPVSQVDWVTAKPDAVYKPGLWLVATTPEGKTFQTSVMRVHSDGSWSSRIAFTRLKFLCEVPENSQFVI